MTITIMAMMMMMMMNMTPAREGATNHITGTRTDWFCFLISLHPKFTIIMIIVIKTLINPIIS